MTIQLDIDQYRGILERAELIYNQEQINAALDLIAQEMTVKLQDKNPLFIGVMRGALTVMSQLLLRLDFPLQTDYIYLSHYGGAVKSRGVVDLFLKPRLSLQGRHIVVVEDILDSGVTLSLIKDYCSKKGALRIDMAALMHKEDSQVSGGIRLLDFYALPVPKRFLLGYGLDFYEFYRNLPAIYAMSNDDIAVVSS